MTLTTLPRGRPRLGQRGQSLVEFALVGPFFLVLLLAVIEAGLFMNAQATIDNMTREVARVVAVCGTTGSSWSWRGKSYPSCEAAAADQEHLTFLPSGSALRVAVCTTIPPSGHCTGIAEGRKYVGQEVEVDVYYTYRYYMDVLLGGAAPTTVLASSARVVVQQ
jgi:hypothetical protein